MSHLSFENASLLATATATNALLDRVLTINGRPQLIEGMFISLAANHLHDKAAAATTEDVSASDSFNRMANAVEAVTQLPRSQPITPDAIDAPALRAAIRYFTGVRKTLSSLDA